MRRLFIIMIGLLAMMAGMNAMAQEIKITLHPGWNWIGYTDIEAQSISTALGDFVPMAGDKIKSAIRNATYKNGVWKGGLTQFIPGYGYKYYSSRTEDVEFSFVLAHSVYVETTEPTDITGNCAVVGGTITISEGSHVFVRGVCWGTEPEPDIDGSHTSDGNETGSFSSTIDGLYTGTTYYVRAYAVYDHGISYGESLSFTTAGQPTGSLNGLFTIKADGDQVYFSKGNLQYQASTDIWRFAGNQWDCIGDDNSNISPAYSGWIDLFGWGTGNNPTNSSADDGSYTSFSDWGINKISNGGNLANIWHTLTKDEWVYLFNTRSTISGIRYAKAQVNGVNGVILLPDYWSSSYYSLNNTNNDEASFSSNIISQSDWDTNLEANGAVFLSAAGGRYGTDVDPVGSYGDYWSSTSYNGDGAYGVFFGDDNLNADNWDFRSSGFNVRLVCSSSQVVSYSVTAQPNPAEGGTIEGAGIYPEGQTCTLTATVNEGYYFMNWTENDEVVSTEATYSFEVSGDRELVANFELILYTITATVNSVAGGIIEGVGVYPEGQICTLMATANEGYYFVNWTENNEVVSTEATYSFEVTGDRELVANFKHIGSLNGIFTINSDGGQVYFSQGNLQYIGSASTPYWKFAEHQWDYLGTTTGQGSTSQNVDRDLFGWGTSGYNHGAVCYQPWSTSNTTNNYYAYGSYTYNLNDQTGRADWGYNPISNGGNQPHHWRTLTKDEWVYVFNTRSTPSGKRYAKAKVNGVQGVILLPDDWSNSYYSLSNTNSTSASYSSNTISASQWNSLEQHGAVFLPAAGYRSQTYVSTVGSFGYYWSASRYISDVYIVYFFASNLYPADDSWGGTYGFSVRLVCSAE